MRKKILSILLIVTILMSYPFSTGLVWADETDEEEVVEEVVLDQSAAEADQDLYGGEEEETPEPVIQTTKNDDLTSYTDISDKYVANAAGLLTALSAVSGYENGLFKPESEMSRYDFTFAVLKLLNISPQVFSTKAYGFKDVENGTTKQLVMSAAVAKGYLGVYDDGSVRPDTPISAYEAVRTVVKALGYSVVAEANGGSDFDYMTIANSLKLTLGLSLDKNISRADAVRLLYRTAIAPLFKQNSWGVVPTFDDSAANTMLSEYHNIYMNNGVVYATHIGAVGDYKNTKENIINIDGKLFESSNRSFSNFLAYKVTYFYFDDEYEYDELIYMYKHNSVSELVLRSDDISSYSDFTYEYYVDNKKFTVNIQKDHNFIYNGTECDSYTDADFIPENGYVQLVSNDGMNYDTVFVWEYYNALVENVFTRDGVAVISFYYGYEDLVMDVSNGETVVDLYNKDGIMDVTIGTDKYLDGDGNWQTRVTLPAIDRYSLVSVYANKTKVLNDGKLFADASATYFKIIINSNSVVGNVESIENNDNTQIVTVKGSQYSVSNSNYLNDTDDVFGLGSYGTFKLDCDGKIAAWLPDKSITSFVYGYLINAKPGTRLDTNIRAKILTQTGDIRIFDFKKETLINGKKRSGNKIIEDFQKSAKMLDSTFTISQLIKYKTNKDGQITSVETVTAETGIYKDFEDTHLKRERIKENIEYREGIGGAYVIKSTHTEDNRKNGTVSTVSRMTNLYQGAPDYFFQVPVTETFDDDDYSVEASWLPVNSSKSCELYDVSAALRPTVVVIYDAKSAATFTYPYMLVTEIETVLNDDETETIVLTGYQGSKLRSYLAKEKSVVADVKVGDFITLAGRNGVIWDYEHVTSVSEILNDNYNVRETSVIPKYTPPNSSNYCAAFEAWDYNDETRALIVQRGTPTNKDNKRDFQKVSWFMSSVIAYGGLTTCTVDKDTGKMTFAMGSISDIKGARQYGIGGCSKVYLVETSNYTWRITLIVNEI